MKKTSFQFRLLLFLACVVSGVSLSAQVNFDQYTLLKSKLPIPDQMKKLASTKADEEYQDLKKNKKDKNLRNKDLSTFATTSNFEIDKLLKSGKVLYNDEMTNYIRSVAKKVLASEPGAFEKITIFTVRSANPNAFTTSQGLIFVNLGLIARLNSEEELAFILCHEYVHYKMSHGLLGFENALKLELEARKSSNRGEYDEDEWIIRDCLFSKEQETEADIKGLEIYLSSVYKNVNPYGGLESLKYSDFPLVGTEKYTPSILESANFKIPSSLIQPDSLYEDYPNDLGDEDDKKSTHPNINRRLQKLNEKHTFKTVATSNSNFAYYKKIAEFESTFYLLAFHYYEFAIAQASYLLKKYPGNAFLKDIHDRAWYTLSVAFAYRTESYYDQRMKDDDISGPFQPAHYMIKRLSKSKVDMSLVALRLAWINSQSSKDSTLWKSRLNNLTYALITEKSVKPSQLDPDTSKVKKKATLKTEFKNIYEDLPNSKGLRNYLMDFYDKNSTILTEKSENERDYKAKIGYRFGCDTLVLFNPNFYSIDFRTETPERHLASEQYSLELMNEIKEDAASLNLAIVNFGNDNYLNGELEKTEEAFWIKLFMMESDLFSESKGNYTSLFHNNISAISEKYHSRYLLTTNSVAAVAGRPLTQVALSWIVLIGAPYLLPYSIYITFTPDREMIVNFSLIDLSGQEKPVEIEYLSKGKYNKLLLSNQMYDMLAQVKYKNKK